MHGEGGRRKERRERQRSKHGVRKNKKTGEGESVSQVVEMIK